MLVDLDREIECAPKLADLWLSKQAAYMCFRVAVRTVEAWLLADRKGISDYLSVPPGSVPPDPESLFYPKRDLVNLARQSRNKEIREDMVPAPGSGISTGPAFNYRLIDFVERRWRPATAAKVAPSLRSCRDAVARLLLGCQ